jgi:basic membrane protein A
VTSQLYAALLAVTLSLVLVGTTGATGAAETFSAAFVYVDPIGETGWTYQHDLGRQCLARQGIQTAYVESVPEAAGVAEVERDFLARGFDLIFATAYGYQPYTQVVSQAHPENYFFGITPTVAPAANILNYYGKLWDARYLTGLVAGAMTQSQIIGFVAAKPIPTVIAGINAFALGVREVNPHAQVWLRWTGSWFDPPAARQAALTLVEAGADVLAQHHDTPEAVRTAAEKGVWAIGSESDMSRFASEKYLTGTLWNWCPFYAQAVDMVRQGRFKAGEFYGDLADGTVALTPLHAAVPEHVRQLVETKRRALVEQTFDYWQGPLQDTRGQVVVAAGSTVTLAQINQMNWLLAGIVGTLP